MPRAASDRGRAPAAPTPTAAIYAIVRRIPRGSVVTYGEVAALAGIANGHRVAARAMRECPEALPWQRVLGKKDARRGHISIDDPDHAVLQRRLLEVEGVEFDASGGVSLARFGWLSKAVGPAAASQAKKTKKKRRPSRKREPAQPPSAQRSALARAPWKRLAAKKRAAPRARRRRAS